MFKGKVILVVDDEADLREILKDELVFEGAEVYEASNGKEALKIVKERKFDAILSDIRMPGGDGKTLAREVREISPSKPVVILITGFADLRSEDAYSLGADGYVTKPFHLEDLKKNLHRLLADPQDRWQVPEEAGVQLKELFVSDSLSDSIKNKKAAIGRGGIFIQMDPKGIRTGDNVEVRFGQNQSIKGVVRWVRGDAAQELKVGVGIEFVALTKEQMEVFNKEAPHWLDQKSVIPLHE